MNGVGLRHRSVDLARAFVRPSRLGDETPFVPFEVPAPSFLPGAAPTLAYRGAAFSPTDRGRIAAFVVYADGASTTRGITIGDSLERANGAYRLRCIEGTEEHGGDTATECFAKTGPGTYVNFVAEKGADAVQAIAISSEPFPGGCETLPNARRARPCLAEARSGRSASP